MKQSLNEQEIQSLVTYRLQRANETLHEADILIENNCFNAAVNRLYYACYYAVIALLIKNHIQALTHDGVKQMFGLHFVTTGKVDRKYSRFYSQLFNDRISGDYDDFLSYDKEMVDSLRPKAEELIQCIKNLING